MYRSNEQRMKQAEYLFITTEYLLQEIRQKNIKLTKATFKTSNNRPPERKKGAEILITKSLLNMRL